MIKFVSLITASFYGYPPDYYGLFQMCIELPVCIIFVITLLKKYSYNSEDLVSLIIIVGIIQTVIGVLMLSIPSFKDLVDTHRHQFWDDRMIGLSTWRMFGFADNLLHITPIVQALIALLIIFKSSKNIFLLFFVPLFFLFCIMNSRTSAFVFVLIVLLYFLFVRKIPNKKRTASVLLILFTFSISSLLILLAANSKEGFEYFVTGYEAIMDVSQGKDNSTVVFSSGYNSITTDLSTLLFGVGHYIQEGLIYDGIVYIGDMGFVNDVWRYGIILSFVLWLVFIHRANYIKQSRFVGGHIMSTIMIVVFLISQFKGTTTYYCDYTVLLLLLSCSFVLDKKREPIIKKRYRLRV